MLLGGGIGHIVRAAADADAAAIAGGAGVATKLFPRLVRAVIAPLESANAASGIVSLRGGVGRRCWRPDELGRPR